MSFVKKTGEAKERNICLRQNQSARNISLIQDITAETAHDRLNCDKQDQLVSILLLNSSPAVRTDLSGPRLHRVQQHLP
jgi:hypothetical protein